jgi:iron(III) transport system permease protein
VTTVLESPAPAAAHPPARGRGSGARAVPRPPLLLVATGVAIAAVFAGPLAYLAVRNARDLSAALDVLRSDDATGPLLRTLALAASVSGACAALGTALAWLVTRTDLPARNLWRVLVPLPLVIPSFVGTFALIAAVSPGGLLDDLVGVNLPSPRGFWPSFVVLTLISYPYVLLPVAARLTALPASLEESARTLGRRPGEVFRSIVLPQSVGAITAGALLVFLYVVSEFGAVSLLRYDTLTTRIYAARLDRPTALALSLLLGLVALVVVVTERSVARRRVHTEAVAAGRRPLVTRLGRWKVPATGFVAGVVTIALLLPVAVLGYWTARGLRGDRLSRVGTDVADDVVQPALNTAGVSVVAALVAVAVLLPVAYLTTRYRSRVGGAVNALVVSGFALPGLVLALAAVFWVLGTPVVGGLYQTFTLLIAAYVIHFGAQSLRSAQVAVSGVPRRLDDAARSLGAGRVRRLITVDGPLMLPGLAAGGGLVLLSTMKELPATLLLRPTGFETLATRIWNATESGFLGKAGLGAIVLVALSGVLTWLVTLRHQERLAA